MIRNYRDLTRWEMEQVDRENTIVLIPLGARWNSTAIRHHWERMILSRRR